jgi:rhodanese-related sulfurtransferase
MVETISPEQARDKIASGEVDVIDVRDVDEWTSGHIPEARPVPLDELRANPDAALKRDSILFVCAKGMRSMTAAKLAERLGFSKLFSLDGGTAAWRQAGLPIVAGQWAGDGI